MQVDKNIPKWLQDQQKAYPKFATFFSDFEKLYDQKLWHQLTVRLQELVEQKESAGLLLALYEHFVSDWKSKMNKISLVKFLVVTSRQLEPQKALEFLTPFIDQLKEEKLCQGAYVLLLTESCVYKLSLAQLEECKDTLKICESLLDSQNEPIIHTTFYRINAEYYKKVNGYPEYYQNALLYLQSIDMNLVTPQERQERAFDLCFSALLGEGLYNFEGTPNAWLRKLLLCYNSGDLGGFDTISKTKEFLGQPLLVSSLAFLRQKLCLMTLMEIVFQRSKEDRGRMSFTQIANETRVTVNEVEHLVMKALSLGLIKGKIDEVDEIVNVSWVQPRVLDPNQIKHLSNRIGEWASKINEKIIALERDESFKTVFAQ